MPLPPSPTSGNLDAHPLARLEVPVSGSVFRIKGTAYIGHLKWVEAELPGGLDAYWEGWKDQPEAVAYQKQRILSSGWYDHFLLARAGIVCARIVNKGFDEFIEYRARNQADLDINGVYRFLFRVAATKMIAGRLPIAMSQYFDYGKIEIGEHDANHIDFHVEGIPVVLASWMTASWKGFLERAIELSGASRPRFLVTTTLADGNREGFELVKVTGRLEWS